MAENEEDAVSKTFLPKGRPAIVPYERDLDRGWAWVVLFAAFTSTAIIFGFFINSTGIYFVAFLNAFRQSRNTTAWIGTALMVTTHSQGPICGLMISKFGARRTMMCGALLVSGPLALFSYFATSIPHLIVCFTFCGIGTGLVIISSIAVMATYFKKYFNVATGVTCSGAGLGILFIGIEMEWAIEAFGWRGSMLIQSGIVLQILVCGALVFPVPLRENSEPSRDACVPTFSVLRDGRLQLMLVSFLLYYGVFSVLILILKDAFLSNHFETPYETIVIYFGIANFAGRLAAGFGAQYFLVPPMHYSIASIINALTPITFIFAQYQWIFILATVQLGLLSGYQAVVQPLSLSYMFGRKRMALLWSYSLLTAIVAMLGLMPLAGWMIDQTGSFVGTFLMATVGLLASGLMTFTSYWLHCKKNHSHSNGEQ